MAIVFVGIDLAKSVFALHGVDEVGKAVLVAPKGTRDKLLGKLAALPPSTVGMEACAGSHHWARLFQALGHTRTLAHTVDRRQTTNTEGFAVPSSWGWSSASQFCTLCNAAADVFTACIRLLRC